MKKLQIHTGVALAATLVCITLIYFGCARDSSVTNYVVSQPSQPPFELDSVAEPPIMKSNFVVLTHSRYLFYNLAKEIASYHGAALIHINDNTFDRITEKLKAVQPEYAIVVLPPYLITPDLVANLFKCFCTMNDDIYPDVQFGYITGYTLDDARDLFYRDQQDTVQLNKFLGVSHVFDGGDWVRPYLANFAEQFRSAGWNGDTAIINHTSWTSNVAEEVKKFSSHQLIFFVGHGDYSCSCDVNASDLVNSDLTGDVVLSGACFTGATCSEGPPSDFIALRILKQGAAAYESRVIVNGWGKWAAASVAEGNTTWGEAVRSGILSEMNQFVEDTLDILTDEEMNEKYPAGNFPLINETARIIPFGDPSFKPKVKSAVTISLM